MQTARELYGVTTQAEYLAWMRNMASVIQRAAVMNIDLATVGNGTAGKANPAIAYVNQGRWVADCPTEGCTGAMALLDGADFLCSNCLNIELGGKWRPVQWPKERKQIESVLHERPLPETRNAFPAETVVDLQRENAEHGHARGGR